MALPSGAPSFPVRLHGPSGGVAPSGARGTTVPASLVAQSTVGWTNVSPAVSPPKLQHDALVDDGSDGYDLWVGSSGGVEYEWSFSGGFWSSRGTITAPVYLAAYDPTDGYVLDVGGPGPGNATWKFHGGVWTNLSISHSPPRAPELMAWDAADGYMVTLGFGQTTQTWGYVGGAWTNHTSGLQPTPRSGAAMAYDASDGEIVLFGGHSATNCPASTLVCGDTWTYKAGTWTNITSSLATAPSPRWGAGLAGNTSAAGGALLFGGHAFLPSPTWYNETYNDTWLFQGGVWTNVSVNLSPLPRYDSYGYPGSTFTYDSSIPAYLLFSGETMLNGYGHNWYTLNDTWEYRTGQIPLSAGASGNPTSGPVPLAVRFTGSASGGSPPYAYAWNFGDGSLGSHAINPNHTYNSTGSFTPTLTITDSASRTATAVATILVVPKLIVSATANPSSGSVPLSVVFNGSASGGTPPYIWTWWYGDGSTISHARNPSHAYNTTGAFPVQLQIMDSGAGNANQIVSAFLNITVVACSPCSLSASASAIPTQGSAPLSVAFNGSALGGSTPYRWNWSFGDGSLYSHARNPTHVYNASGTFVATLTVTDSVGATARGHVWINVTAILHATLAFNSPNQGYAPLTVSMTGNATGGKPSYAYAWAFGDGTSGVGVTVSHTYAQPAGCGSGGSCNDTVTLTVSDSSGATATATGVVTITPNSTASLHAGIRFNSPSSGYAPLTVTVTGNATGGTAPYTFAWTFGDGAATTGTTVSHTYHAPAGCGSGGSCSYNMTLTAQDSVGHSARAVAVVSIWPNGTKTFNATISLSPSSGTAPLPVSLDGNASGGQSPYTFVWAFGDGSTATGATVQHTYVQAGTFAVVLTAVDAKGGVAQATSSVQVSPPPPPNGTGYLEISIDVRPATGPAPLTVHFTGFAQGGQAPYTYSWNFGDNTSTANGSSVFHTYAVQGVYVAALFVSDSVGDQASTGVFITAYGSGSSGQNGLAVSVTAFALHGPAPFTATFSSAIHGGSAPFQLVWNFGDGSPAVSASKAGLVSHTYSKPGTYFPHLQVTDSVGSVAQWATTQQGTGHPVSVTGTSAPTSSIWTPWLIAGIVGAVVAVAALMVGVRRRRFSSSSGATETGKAYAQYRVPEATGEGTEEGMGSDVVENDPMADAL
ncbi:MAG: PKD domain-containing protein [Euryarchaeota archaeon]|nr:PKD domain-containing protein [Euryarchaeota archaeon]MDE1837208.1 PKD domain-containing protein [Euryarchaeota archaeon]MDE2045364.1 PKD domain-containing protein [Thermoplasmata archaeon]